MKKERVEDRLAGWGVGSNFGTKLVLEAIAERAAPDTPTETLVSLPNRACSLALSLPPPLLQTCESEQNTRVCEGQIFRMIFRKVEKEMYPEKHLLHEHVRINKFVRQMVRLPYRQV